MQRDLITVSVFSHNELVREGLKRLLAEGRFNAVCHPSAELVDRIDELADDPYHVLLIEGASGAAAIALAAEVRGRLGEARLAVLTRQCEQADLRDAMAAGVDAYLSMGTHHVPLLLMLELVALGEKVYPKQFFEADAAAAGTGAGRAKAWLALKPRQDLSRREFGILECLVDGDPNKVIARKLGITEATVKIHVKGILRKLNVLNRTQAAIWMISNKPRGDMAAVA